MTDPIAIALSGGVDSLVSAYLLKQRKIDAFGIHFLSGYEKPAELESKNLQDLGRQLDMPVVVVDLRASFKTMVVDYFVAAYQKGETPNPCLVCNPAIKFDLLLTHARKLGAARLATGHYARVTEDPGGGFRLRKGMDESKDQSYFLSRLTQNQLARACFPLGDWTKDQVKTLAAEKGLQPITRQESQDVCFIRDTTYTDFLMRSAGIQSQPGDIIDTGGKKVGIHNGLHRFTIGQRKGINCPAGQAYYVVKIDIRNNRLVVGFKDECMAPGCRVKGINWITKAPCGSLAVHTRIRYRHRAAASVVSPVGIDRAEVRFEHPQNAVTPGQGAVFYQGDEVVGGGWIDL